MTWKRIFNVEEGRVVLDLPADFNRKRVLVVVEDVEDARAEKLRLMQNAASDPLFLADVAAVQDDFRYVDGESL